MATKMEQVEDIYERLYQVSLQIEELIERELYTELVKYLTKKEQLLSESAKVISQIKGETASEKLKEIVDKYQKQEQKNILALSKIKEETRKKLIETGKNAKLVGAYRQNREHIKGNILDFSE